MKNILIIIACILLALQSYCQESSTDSSSVYIQNTNYSSVGLLLGIGTLNLPDFYDSNSTKDLGINYLYKKKNIGISFTGLYQHVKLVRERRTELLGPITNPDLSSVDIASIDSNSETERTNLIIALDLRVYFPTSSNIEFFVYPGLKLNTLLSGQITYIVLPENIVRELNYDPELNYSFGIGFNFNISDHIQLGTIVDSTFDFKINPFNDLRKYSLRIACSYRL